MLSRWLSGSTQTLKMEFSQNNNNKQTTKNLHGSIHGSIDKLVTILNWHWWVNFTGTVQDISKTYSTCQQLNPGKTVKVEYGQFLKILQLSEYLPMDFIQTPAAGAMNIFLLLFVCCQLD